MAKEDKNNKLEEEKNENANEQGGEGEEGEGGAKKSKPKLNRKNIIIIVAVLVFIVAAAIAAFYFMGHSEKKTDGNGDSSGESSEDIALAKGGNIAVFYDMEELLVNLNVGSKRPSFLKVTISLEVANELQIPVVERNMPRVRDSFQTYLRELRQEDLQGSAGLYRLREELLLRVNKIVYPAKVNDILFGEILVQ